MRFHFPILQKRVLALLRRISPKFAFIGPYSIARLLPETEWYSATLRITRFLTGISIPFTGAAPYRANWMLHYWLKWLLRLNQPFPIPVRAVGTEAVSDAKSNPHGMVVISVHLPLTNLGVRALAEIGCPPDAVLSHGDLLIDGMFPLGGTAVWVPGLPTEGGTVLVKVRSILRRGGSIAAMIDTELGAPLNPNILRFLGSVGARLVFYITELGKNGEILVKFYTPPDPFCTSSEGVLSNIQFFQNKVDELLQPESKPHSEDRLDPSVDTLGPVDDRTFA